MTVQEIVAAIPTLSLDERLALLKVLTHSLRSAERPNKTRGVPASEVRGLLKTNSPPPSDEEIKEICAEYLLEKDQ